MIQNIELSPILLTKQMMSTNGKKWVYIFFIFDKYIHAYFHIFAYEISSIFVLPSYEGFIDIS